MWQWVSNLFNPSEGDVMSDDFSGVQAAWDKASYASGDTVTGTISGQDVQTTTSESTVGPLVVPLVSADGAKSTITFPAVPVTITTVLPESVTIDTSLPIVDNGPNPRTWVVSADKLSISASANLPA